MIKLVDDLESFKDTFPKNFWLKISNQYLKIPEKRNYKKIIEEVYKSLNNQNYYPSKPCYYIDKNKGNGVLRRIPVLELKDYLVYFYCLKKLESKLAMNRVPNTYGGWSLGGLIRQSEKEELKPLTGNLTLDWSNNSSIPTFSYNERAWVQYYGDFQKNLYAHLNEMLRKNGTKFLMVVKFDIEKFYDSIRLNLLEKNIRAICDTNHTPIVDLLIHFLKYWNRDINGYDSQQTGLPQDALADCSRILANFYLQTYDQQIYDYTNKNKSHFFRYSDDQIIITQNYQEAENSLHKASIELSKVGLNINKAKVSYFTLQELIDHFSFKEFKALSENKNNSKTLQEVAESYLNAGELTKKEPLLYKILDQDLSILRHDLRTRLLSDSYEKKFITIYSNSHTFFRIYKNLKGEEKVSFIKYLDGLCQENEFTGFHFELLNFYREIKKNTQKVEKRIKGLQEKWS